MYPLVAITKLSSSRLQQNCILLLYQRQSQDRFRGVPFYRISYLTCCNILICNRISKVFRLLNSLVLCQYNHTLTIHSLWHFIVLISERFFFCVLIYFSPCRQKYTLPWIYFTTYTLDMKCSPRFRLYCFKNLISAALYFTRNYNGCLCVLYTWLFYATTTLFSLATKFLWCRMQRHQ
jgi:hypothetical protein